jgi:regulator of sigma E protease
MEERKFLSPSAQQFQVGDVIVAVDGDRSFDAVRLPDILWSKARTDNRITLTVRRGDKELPIEVDALELRGRGTWEEQQPSNLPSPTSIPALGICYTVQPIIKGIDSGSEAEKAKVQPGSILLEVTYHNPVSDRERTINLTEDSDYGPNQWTPIFMMLQSSGKSESIELKLREPSGNERLLTLTSSEDKTWPHPMRGLNFEYDTVTVQADGIGQAVLLGFRETYRTTMNIYLSLRGFVARYLNLELISGPFKLAEATYLMADQGLIPLILILGMISINLAVVNFLPIPILDGGHMVFLIIEKLRGKPASERALIIANSIGLVIIASLMLFVIILDISKYAKWL